MRRLLSVLALSICVLAGFAPGAHASSPPALPGEATLSAASDTLNVSPAASEPAVQEAAPAAPAAPEGKAEAGSEAEEDDFDYDMEDVPAAEQVTIADPWEPFNRAMHTVNDKMYFWLLKPAAQGYKFVVPEPARVSVKHFFSNLKYPVRLVSCLLQADFAGAATETGRTGWA